MYSYRNLLVVQIIILAISFFHLDYALAEYINLPKDNNGWTIFTPSNDSRIVYVSSGGNDSTGSVYSPSNTAIGNDPFKPTGPILPFKTYAAAFSHTREGYPDWILMKRGDVFFESIGNKLRSGRSATEPSLVAAYGKQGSVPEFRTGSQAGIKKIGNLKWAAIANISFYAHTRNPEDPDYHDPSGTDGITIATNDSQYVEGIIIEGCRVRFYSGNQLGVLTHKTGQTTGIIFRRNAVLDNYSTIAHSQGLWSYGLINSLFEENIFDHNGWLIQHLPENSGATGGQATAFNHNTYFASTKNITFKNNVFSRGSSGGNKWTAEYDSSNIKMENNLYIDNEVPISMGNNYHRPYKFKNISISNNVFINSGESQQTSRTLAWNIWLQDMDSCTVSKNLLIHNDNSSVTNSIGILLNRTARGLTVQNNIFYNLKGVGISINSDEIWNNVLFIYNDIQDTQPTNKYAVWIKLANNSITTGSTWQGNNYLNGTASGTTFRIGTTNYNITSWSAASNDRSSVGKVAYPDPSRNIIRYQQHIGQPATKHSFFANIRKQTRYNWNVRYTAPVIDSWLRAGFAMQANQQDGGGSISPPVNFQLIAQ